MCYLSTQIKQVQAQNKWAFVGKEKKRNREGKKRKVGRKRERQHAALLSFIISKIVS